MAEVSSISTATERETITDNVVEFALCATNPIHYLSRFAYIQNKNTAKVVKWECWPYLRDTLEIVEVFSDIIILKARQLGFSWTLAGYGEHKAKFNDAARILYLSQKEEDAWSLLSKSHCIWEHCPSFLQVPIAYMGRAWLEFESGSEIRVLASVANAGRGTDATLVVRDEAAQHPYGEENYVAITPAIEGGGKIIDISTINKLDPHNHFTERVERALRGATRRNLPSGISVFTGGESKATLIFAGWKLRPVRIDGMSLDEWFETKVRPTKTDVQLEQEYPETIEQALTPSREAAYFDVSALDDMQMQVSPPIKDFKDFDTFNGVVRVHKRPVVGRQYVVFTDPSEGIEDPFVTVVIDAATGEGVCSATGMLPSKEVAKVHDHLVRQYNNAFNTGELNAQAGGGFINTLNDLQTPNRAPRRTADGKIIPGKIGWQMNQPLREKSLSDLREAVRTQSITVHDCEAVDEFRRFLVLGTDARGHVKMEGKFHDDWVMAWAGVWQIRKYAPIGHWKVTSGKYRD